MEKNASSGSPGVNDGLRRGGLSRGPAGCAPSGAVRHGAVADRPGERGDARSRFPAAVQDEWKHLCRLPPSLGPQECRDYFWHPARLPCGARGL